jgi:hypothetical protein
VPPGPPQPPQKKGPNWALIIGLGCGGLFLLTLLIGGGVALFMYSVAKKDVEATVPTPAASGAPEEPWKPPSTAPPKAELRDVRTWKSDTIGFRHFIGEIVNTGTEPIGSPRAKITLYDAQGTAIESGNCFTLLRSLEPGARIPCSVIVTAKIDRFASWRAEIAGSPIMGDRVADLRTTDVKYTPKKGYTPASLEGKITNGSAFRARNVAAIVSLYGADGKIVAAQNAIVAGGDLDAGASAMFSAKVFDYAAAPETYRVRAVGYE